MQRAHRHDLGHPAVKMGLQKLYNTKRVRGIERRRYNTNHYQEKELDEGARRYSGEVVSITNRERSGSSCFNQTVSHRQICFGF